MLLSLMKLVGGQGMGYKGCCWWVGKRWLVKAVVGDVLVGGQGRGCPQIAGGFFGPSSKGCRCFSFSSPL